MDGESKILLRSSDEDEASDNCSDCETDELETESSAEAFFSHQSISSEKNSIGNENKFGELSDESRPINEEIEG